MSTTINYYILSILFILLFSQTSHGNCWQKIASKHDHVVAIHLDGTLWHWGGASGSHRLLTVPAILDSGNHWIDVVSGNHFFAALKADGTLWTWGNNSYGQLGNGASFSASVPTQVGTESNWSKVSCGDGHMVAIKTDGSLWIWGRNNYGQLGKGTNRTNSNIPEQLGTETNWTEVSAGKNHTLIKKSNNTLWFVGACYGTQVSQLWQVGTTSDWATMSGGSFTDYAIKLNGQLWTWNNSNGKNTAPVRVGNASNWLKVDNSHAYSPEYHALFLKTDSSLWAIGNNKFGQLGDGTTINQTVPIQIGSNTNWIYIVAGSHYSFALKNDQGVWAWGRNNHAQFGNGHNKTKITHISSNDYWKEVSSSTASYNGHTLAIRNDGSLWAWGQNNDGQLGNGSTYTHQVLPLQIGTDTIWKTVTNGFHFSIGVKNDGTLWSWGRNGRNQLGLGDHVFKENIPKQVGLDSNWAMASAGTEFVIALKQNGTLWAWGYNYDGQLGDGTTNTIETPTQIGTDSNWLTISTGNFHSLALKTDSTLWTWGSNQHGQLGRSGFNRTPIQVDTAKWIFIDGGGLHSLGIREDNTLWAWGRNLYAQLGDGSTNNKSLPVQIGTDSTWKSIAGGHEHSLGIKTDGSLWAWGRNAQGQLADSISYSQFLSKQFIPIKVNDDVWLTINAGPVNSVGIKSDGSLHTWGDSYSADNQTNQPQLGYIYSSPQEINACTYCNSTFSMSEILCEGDSILFNDIYYSEAGNYQKTLMNAAGCDSIVTLYLSVKQPALGTDLKIACESFTWINGITYTSDNYSASHTIYGGAANGCDSIVTLNLTIKNPGISTNAVTSCGAFTWIDGITYTTSNNSASYIITDGANNGCDSIIDLDLTIKNIAESTDNITTCDSFTWIDGITYNSSNNIATYTIAGGAENGCDSVVNLNLIINNATTATDVVASCEPYTWIDGITYQSDNNTATYSLLNSSGCDSMITLNLTINSSTTSMQTETACDSYIWNGNIYTTSDTYFDTIPNTAGCDSVMTLNLTINHMTDVEFDLNPDMVCTHVAAYPLTGGSPGGGIYSGAGVSSGNFNPDEAGIGTHTITYTLTDANNCTDSATAQIFVDDCTSISPIADPDNSILIYPNPNSGKFIIQIDQKQQAEVKIYNLVGKVIYQSIFQNPEIDLSAHAKGIYFIVVKTEDKLHKEKLIIQ